MDILIKAKIRYKIFFRVNKKIRKQRVYEYRHLHKAMERFNALVTENRKNVILPRLYMTTAEKVYRSQSVITLASILPEEMGGGVEIIKSVDWLQEEEFFVYVDNERMTVEEILTKVFTKFKGVFTKVWKYKNKIVLDDSENLACIQTKNLSEAIRLYDKLKELIAKYKIYNFLFLGEVQGKKFKSELIVRLCEYTGLKRFQFSRSKSRH